MAFDYTANLLQRRKDPYEVRSPMDRVYSMMGEGAASAAKMEPSRKVEHEEAGHSTGGGIASGMGGMAAGAGTGALIGSAGGPIGATGVAIIGGVMGLASYYLS